MAINPSLLIVPYRYKAAKLYSQLPESGAGDFVVTRGTTATRVNASGLIESVASGVPRLDYTGGGCPSLLVEPAATNLASFSEQFNNSIWQKSGVTVSENTGIAPNGTTTADLVTISPGGTISRLFTSLTITTGQAYTFSCFVKTSTRAIIFGGATSGEGTVVYNGAQDVGNGWYRQSVTRTWSVSGTFNIQLVWIGTFGFTSGEIWGAQLETGSVATSYIPAEASTVTRNADVISVSSASGLIGQSQGTLYAELKATNFSDGARIFTISNGTVNNSISLQKQSSNRLRAVVTTASGTVADISTASGQVAGTYKIALAYAANDFALYINGTQIGTDTSGAVPATSKVNFGSGATDDNQANDGISAAAIYTSRLSNSELQSLTQL
jgi:hypothetical protein